MGCHNQLKFPSEASKAPHHRPFAPTPAFGLCLPRVPRSRPTWPLCSLERQISSPALAKPRAPFPARSSLLVLKLCSVPVPVPGPRAAEKTTPQQSSQSWQGQGQGTAKGLEGPGCQAKGVYVSISLNPHKTLHGRYCDCLHFTDR